MGILGRLLGSDRAVESAVNMIGGAFDKLVYTKEERAEDAARDTSEARAMIIDWVRNSQGQNLSRRVLAFMIAGTWLIMHLAAVGVAVSITFIGNESTADMLGDASSILGEAADGMNGAVMLILGFYFAAPHLDKIVRPAMERFSSYRAARAAKAADGD